MIEDTTYRRLVDEIRHQVDVDAPLLEELRKDVRPLAQASRRIFPRSATAVSLVATDGGNNQLRFDPFLLQIVRIVDSNEKELCLELLSPTTPIADLNARQFDKSGRPRTALGRLMQGLGVGTLPDLSHMIRPNEQGLPRSWTVVQTYRELVEWAVLYDLVKTEWGSDTLIIFDGDLRRKIFAGEQFSRFGKLLEAEIQQHTEKRRSIFVVGVMKSSKVLSRYRLAMALEGVLRGSFPAYVEVPRALEEKVYLWSEMARGSDNIAAGGEAVKFVLGKKFFVKFGARPRDPIWPVDVFVPQVAQVDKIFSYLLADAIEGFPVPLYPRCLQKAHERAALTDFDMDMLQDAIFTGLRSGLGSVSGMLDAFRLEDADPAQGRYR